MKTFLGGEAAPGFDNPLEMLLACHGKIGAQCATLEKLLQHLPIHGCDLQAQQAAQAILRYFDTAGLHHHQDEEQDLFPVLLAIQDVAAQHLIARLLDEHKMMEATWQTLRQMLLEISKGNAVTLSGDISRQFIDAYQRHITLENTHLLPLAAHLLSQTQLATLGNSMAKRRGAINNMVRK